MVMPSMSPWPRPPVRRRSGGPRWGRAVRARAHGGSRRRLAAAIGDLRHPDGRDLADGLFRHGIPCRDRELVRGSTVAALTRIRALAGVEVPQSPYWKGTNTKP